MNESTPLLVTEQRSSPTLSSTSGLNPTAFAFFPRTNSTFIPPSRPTTLFITTASLHAAEATPDHHVTREGEIEDVDTHHSDSSSSFSYDSLPPSRISFHRSYWLLQLPVAFGSLAVLFIGLILWTKEIRWIELAIGAAAFLTSESVRVSIFESIEGVGGRTGLGLATALYAVMQEVIRLGGIALVVKLLPKIHHHPHSGSLSLGPLPPPPNIPRRLPLPPLDTLFWSALYFALGWAFLEIIWASREFYTRMQLYDDVLLEYSMIDEEEEMAMEYEEDQRQSHEEIETTGEGFNKHTKYDASTTSPEVYPQHQHHTGGTECLTDSAFARVMDPIDKEEREAGLDARIRRLERDNFEATLGVSLYEIPVIITIVWRIDSILLSLVLTLLLALPFRTTSPSLFPFPLLSTFIVCATIHTFLSMLWIFKMRSTGIAAISYTTIILLLAMLFSVLAAWGALN